MQNFIRVCVANAAEDVRIGERALESVILRLQRRGECPEAGIERFDSSGV